MDRLFDPARFFKTIGVLLACLAVTACSAEVVDDSGRQLPSDRQVIADVTPRDESTIDQMKSLATDFL